MVRSGLVRHLKRLFSVSLIMLSHKCNKTNCLHVALNEQFVLFRAPCLKIIANYSCASQLACLLWTTGHSVVEFISACSVLVCFLATAPHLHSFTQWSDMLWWLPMMTDIMASLILNSPSIRHSLMFQFVFHSFFVFCFNFLVICTWRI